MKKINYYSKRKNDRAGNTPHVFCNLFDRIKLDIISDFRATFVVFPGCFGWWHHHGDRTCSPWEERIFAGSLWKVPQLSRLQGLLWLRSAHWSYLVGTQGTGTLSLYVIVIRFASTNTSSKVKTQLCDLNYYKWPVCIKYCNGFLSPPKCNIRNS